MNPPGSPGPGLPEVTGLVTAHSYAGGMSAALAAAAPDIDAFVASLTGHGVTVNAAAITAAEHAKHTTLAASAAWAEADAALQRQGVVREAYTAVPDAGTKAFVTDQAPAQHSAPPEPVTAGPPSQAPVTEPATTAGDPDAEAAHQRAVAQFDVVKHVALLARNAEAMLANLDDGDEDPEELFRHLARQIGELAGEVGLGPCEQAGAVVAYDPGRHWHAGDDEPPAGTPVKVRDPGQQWHHGGREPHSFTPARTINTDDEHGDYIVVAPSGLDEEEPQQVWVELPDIDALEEYDVDEHPEDRHRVPSAYYEPDWYEVTMVEDCDGSPEYHGGVAAPDCQGRLLHFPAFQGDGTDAIHYAVDARLLLSYNDE